MICGTLGTAEPFSFQDPRTREIVGYDVDICRKVAESLGVTLELKPMATEARIPELFKAGLTFWPRTLDTRRSGPSRSTIAIRILSVFRRCIVTKESEITSFEQLGGKKVTALKGTTSEQGVRRLIPTAETVTFQDTSAAFLALVQGKVDGFCASELILVKLKKQAEKSEPLEIIAKPLFVEPWGLGLRKGEPAFKEAVNKALSALDASGEADTIFTKWFGPSTVYDMKRDFKIEEIKD